MILIGVWMSEVFMEIMIMHTLLMNIEEEFHVIGVNVWKILLQKVIYQ
jgi:hypothetical protein